MSLTSRNDYVTTIRFVFTVFILAAKSTDQCRCIRTVCQPSEEKFERISCLEVRVTLISP